MTREMADLMRMTFSPLTLQGCARFENFHLPRQYGGVALVPRPLLSHSKKAHAVLLTQKLGTPGNLSSKKRLVPCNDFRALYQQQYGMIATFVLPVNLYGPRDNFDLGSRR